MSDIEEPLGDFPKALIIGCSLASGFMGATMMWALTHEPLLAILMLIIIPVPYAFIGAVVIPMCEELKQWAYFGEASQWAREDKAMLGAIWPLTLIVCAILYTFLGIIHRNY